MSYDDFWFIDTRVQTRNLRRWLIWFILLFAFVSVATVMTIKTMYHDIKVYEIQSEVPTVTVSEAKTTNVNGYIKGEVKNESKNEITGKYLCFLLYNSKGELVGTEYIDIGTMGVGTTQKYELKFKKDKVDRFYITTTDNKNV